MENVGTCGGNTLNLYHHAPTIYGLYKAYGGIFEEQTAIGYSPRGTHILPLKTT